MKRLAFLGAFFLFLSGTTFAASNSGMFDFFNNGSSQATAGHKVGDAAAKNKQQHGYQQVHRAIP